MLDHRGRVTIPNALRDELQIEARTTFTVVREGTDIRLVRQLTDKQTLMANSSRDEWGEDAFRAAGEVTFGVR